MTTAERRRIEQLSGQVLAVDVSIWLVKIASRYPDLSQQLRCFLDKIVLLKRNNILPVFVFDGVAPLLKRHTLAGRRRKRVIAEDL